AASAAAQREAPRTSVLASVGAAVSARISSSNARAPAWLPARPEPHTVIAARSPSSTTVTTDAPIGSSGEARRLGEDTAHDGGTGASIRIRDTKVRPPSTSDPGSGQR